MEQEAVRFAGRPLSCYLAGMFKGVTFNLDRLVRELLGTDWSMPGNAWREDCEIIPEYQPRNPAFPARCVVRHVPSGSFLRHSKGPRQGHGWDIYGDDYHNPELALIALSEAPPPPQVVAQYAARQHPPDDGQQDPAAG